MGGSWLCTADSTCNVSYYVVFNGRPEVSGVLRVDNKVSLLGGVIGAFITFTVVKSVSELGIAKSRNNNSGVTGNSSLFNRAFWIVWK